MLPQAQSHPALHAVLQLIQLVLTYATQETDNPDLRDRAYIYWRLLSTDPGGKWAASVRRVGRRMSVCKMWFG
jgi:vesicle coat complex subunit